MGTRDQPRNRFGGPNGIANGHFGPQRVTSGGDGKHKAHGEWGHRRRQFVGCGNLGRAKDAEISLEFRAGDNFDTYPCGPKCFDETVEVEERTGLYVMYVM